MALILGIETATGVCSVALVKDNNLLALRESSGTREHSAMLTGYINDVMTETGNSFGELDAVAVSIGPGSYTGLRIGVSSAKGLCYALDKPIITIDTLKALAWQAKQFCFSTGLNTENALFIPMLDARRMEVYTAVYDQELNIVEPVNALVITDSAFDSLSQRPVYYFGEGAAKCTELFSSKTNFSFLSDINLSANAVAMLAQQDFASGNFASLAYCEPFYLKDFIAGKPRVKGLYE